MGGLPDPEWYFENVLQFAEPGVGNARTRATPSARWQAWWRAAGNGEAVVRLAARQGFVVTCEQAMALGYGRRRIATLIRRGRWTDTPVRGVVSPIDITEGDPFLVERRRHALACAAAALRRPNHVVSARSEAILRGLPTLVVPVRPELTGPSDSVLGRRATAHVFGAALLTSRKPETWFGVPITGSARMVVDVARHDRREGVIVTDAALHDRLVAQPQLEHALTTAGGWPGVRCARWVVRFADGLAESPLESLVRLALFDDEFPRPALQVRIAGYRVDLLLEECGLIVEADGRKKYTDDELWQEKLRQQVLRRHGFEVERVVWDDVMRNWPATAMRLRAAMTARRHLPLRS